MTTTAASRAAAGAMADSARAWHTWFGGAHQAGSDIDPYGPYLIVAAASEARRNLTMFTGAPIPHLSQDTDRVAARTWSLYVLPGSVYRRLARARLGVCRLFERVDPGAGRHRGKLGVRGRIRKVGYPFLKLRNHCGTTIYTGARVGHTGAPALVPSDLSPTTKQGPR